MKRWNVISGVASTLFVASILTVSAAFGQDTEVGPQPIEEIIVTASRREEALQDVAMAVANIDAVDFAKSGYTTVADVFAFVPGVFIEYRGQNFFENDIYIRGINAFGAAGVTTYVDDIDMGRIDGLLLDLEQVTILKGPQGTLYGSSAMGGLVKYTTRRPSLESWSGNVSADLSLSYHGHGDVSQLYRVSANGPLSSNNVGVSFTAFWKDYNGFIDDALSDDVDDYEFSGGSGSLLWTPTDNLEVKIQGLYQISVQDGSAVVELDISTGNPVPSIGKYTTDDIGQNPLDLESKVIGATINYEMDWATLTSVTSYQEQGLVQTEDFTFLVGLIDFLFPAGAPHGDTVLVDDNGFDKFIQELRLTSASNQKFEWLVGLYYSDRDSSGVSQVLTTPMEPIFSADQQTDFIEKAAFASGTYYFTPDLDASIGIRYSQNESTLGVTAVGPFLDTTPATTTDENITTYLFNLRYRLNDDMSFYGRAASGYRPGGTRTSTRDPVTGALVDDPFFLPDELWSYEAGVKGRSLGGRLAYDVAAFFIDWQDYQIFVTRGGLSTIGNATEASSRGVEASVSLAATDALTFKATVSYVDAQLDVDEPDLGGAKGDQLPHNAQWDVTMGFNYDFNMWRGIPAYFGGSYRYSDEFPVGFDGVTINGQFFPASAPRYFNESYNVVDLKTGFTTGRFETSLYVTNLLDEYKFSNVDTFLQTNAMGGTDLFASGNPLRPRTVGVWVQVNFD